jgi:hypothetical protein
MSKTKWNEHGMRVAHRITEYEEGNEQIAFALGFRKTLTRSHPNFVQWDYPEEWRHRVCSWPVTDIPDFIGTLKDADKFAQHNWMRFAKYA